MSDSGTKSLSSNSELHKKMQKIRFSEVGPTIEEFGEDSGSDSGRAEPRSKLSSQIKSLHLYRNDTEKEI